MNVQSVLARRETHRRALIGSARSFADSLDPVLGVRAVVVFGSVARGDFNLWSDVDVLVVADALRGGPLERMERLGRTPAGVQPIAWTPEEWTTQLARNNAIAREALNAGVWLVGSPQQVA